ncbi:MAG TPA: type II secretion system protein GspG [Planctomycetota bacterium]|nr:type II secretion system protein GspG [Planctomycetota bacterium]
MCAFAVLAIVACAHSGEINLVQNPGFEEGDKCPAHWDRPDGLTMFWEKDELRGGKCIRLYTNVDNDEFLKRYDEMKLDNPPPPKPPRAIKGAGYDTVGGNDGVPFYSEYIAIKPGMKYTLSADARSEKGGAPKIFIKGYTEQMTEIADENGKAKTVPLRRITYKGDFDFDAPKQWKTTSATFSPTGQRDDVKWIRVKIWAYWPPQNYWFDNIKVVEAGLDPEAPKRWAKKKQSVQDEAAKAKNEQLREARAALAYLRKGIDQFKQDTGAPPKNLQALLKDPGVPKWNGPYVVDIGEDPWGKPWKYSIEGKEYTLKSLGPDGEDNTGDEVE